MRVNLTLDALSAHLLVGRFEDVVARNSRLQVLQHDFLHPVRSLHPVFQSLRDVRLTGMEDIAKVLHVGVHAHGADPEINVQDVAFVDY